MRKTVFSHRLNYLRNVYHGLKGGLRSFLGLAAWRAWWSWKMLRLKRRLGLLHRPSRTRYLLAPAAFEAEGIGGQFIKWNSARMWAKANGLTFVHIPFTRSSHSGEFDWEEFLGFGNGELNVDTIKLGTLRQLLVPPLHLTRNELLVGSRALPHDFIDLLLSYDSSPVIHLKGPSWIDVGHWHDAAELRRRYEIARNTWPVSIMQKSKDIRIALHVRRGDVRQLFTDKHAEGYQRWLDETYYVNVCASIHKVIAPHRTEIFVYSDDSQDAFSALTTVPNIHFRAENDNKPLRAEVAFHEMTAADILVIGRSSFSYLAALLNKSLVLSPRGYSHDGPTSWIECAPDGSVPPSALDKHPAISGLFPGAQATS